MIKKRIVSLSIAAALLITSWCNAQQTITLTWPALHNEYPPSTGQLTYPFKVPDGNGGERPVIVPLNVTYHHADAANEKRTHSESVYSDTGEMLVFDFAVAWHEFNVEPQAWSASVTAYATYTIPLPWPNAGETYTWSLLPLDPQELSGDLATATFNTQAGDWERKKQ